MIALYRKENLDTPYAMLPINSGSISGERNGYHSLSFSVLNRYLQERCIAIDHNTLFKVGSLYYAHTQGGHTDTQLITTSYQAELLQTQVLMFKYVQNITLEGTTLQQALTAILEDTLFIVGPCDSLTAFNFQVTNTNAQQALVALMQQTGTEVVYDGLSVSLKQNHYVAPLVLKKGLDFKSLDEQTDVSDVITKLYFSNSKGDLTGEITSEYVSLYDFEREAYQTFEGDTLESLTEQAIDYLQTVDKPRVSLSISIPKVKGLSLELCQVVRLHHTLLNQDLDYKVVGYTRSLTKDDDTYELGERKKDFADIQEIVSQEVANVAPDMIVEVIEKEVISAKTAHILNAWVRDLNVEYLETNFDALDTRKTPPIDYKRNCIRIQDERIYYITQGLSTTEVQDYMNKDGCQIYYTAIDEHPQAYNYFTLTDPRSIYPDLSDEQVEGFKVKIRKIESESIKASFEFGETGEDVIYPMMVWGVGTDTSGTTDNGKGFIFKGLDGLVLRYVTSGGDKHEIKLGENGIEGLPTMDLSDIEIPGMPVSEIAFYQDGIRAKYGETIKKWGIGKDDEGRIIWFYDLDTRIPVDVIHKETEELPLWE